MSRRLHIERLESRDLLSISPTLPPEPITGIGVNPAHPTYGIVSTDLLRLAPVAFADGIGAPNGASDPSARVISNVLGIQPNEIPDVQTHDSDFVWAWGQFLDHDLDRVDTGSTPINIPVPTGDSTFDPLGLGNQVLPDSRSVTDPASGTSTSNPLKFPNSDTTWIDGSMVYGSDLATANALRTFSGGHLATSAGNLLSHNTSVANADATGVPAADLFAAGDVRTNENVILTSIITTFTREHNLWADKLHAANPSWNDQKLYDTARSIVIAEIQQITYNQWLPAQGITLKPYDGFNSSVNPAISAEFNEAAFRALGHSQIDSDVKVLDPSGNPINFTYTYPGIGTIPINGVVDPEAGIFFNPYLIDNASISGSTVINGLVKYLASNPGQAVDLSMVDGIRNILFGAPDSGAGGQDLFALDVQRGRDVGLNTLNGTRAALHLPAYTSFAQINPDPTIQAELQSLYGSVNNVELFAGGLAEVHVGNSVLGSTFSAIIKDQFQRLRDGDPYFYLNQPSLAQYGVSTVTLGQIIARADGLTGLQSNVFLFDVSVSGTVTSPPVFYFYPAKPLAGITVQLLDSDNNIVATTTTDAKGNYKFDNLDIATQYHVQLVLGNNQKLTSKPPAPVTAAAAQAFTGLNFQVSTSFGYPFGGH